MSLLDYLLMKPDMVVKPTTTSSSQVRIFAVADPKGNIKINSVDSNIKFSASKVYDSRGQWVVFNHDTEISKDQSYSIDGINVIYSGPGRTSILEYVHQLYLEDDIAQLKKIVLGLNVTIDYWTRCLEMVPELSKLFLNHTLSYDPQNIECIYCGLQQVAIFSAEKDTELFCQLLKSLHVKYGSTIKKCIGLQIWTSAPQLNIEVLKYMYEHDIPLDVAVDGLNIGDLRSARSTESVDIIKKNIEIVLQSPIFDEKLIVCLIFRDIVESGNMEHMQWFMENIAGKWSLYRPTYFTVSSALVKYWSPEHLKLEIARFLESLRTSKKRRQPLTQNSRIFNIKRVCDMLVQYHEQ